MDSAPATASAHLTRAGRATLGRTAQGMEEARRSWRIILQATLAASLAYAAALALGHDQPFFAPIAAIATVAVSLAHRLRRSAELLLGNAIGILFADLLIAQIGTGVWQLGLVVAIALTTAIMAGGGPILIMQASSAGILIATLTPPTEAQPWNTSRFVDALIGGLVGLVVSALVMPVDPARHAHQVTLPVITAIASGYRRVAAALTDRDPDGARAVLDDLRGTAPVLASFHAGLDATRESVRLSPWYWGQRQTLTTYTLAGGHLDNALRNLRVLARQVSIALDRGDHVPSEIQLALSDLADGVEALGPALAGDGDVEPVRTVILDAVTAAAAAPSEGLFTAPMVAQIRMSASDLLQATDMTVGEAATAIRAVGDTPGPRAV
ncbi:MAG TPA: FUSC family protein [Motilibacterales bacterium]|nr:FUSC family protein [Motilibacterales bacterium]